MVQENRTNTITLCVYDGRLFSLHCLREKRADYWAFIRKMSAPVDVQPVIEKIMSLVNDIVMMRCIKRHK